ncbi:heme ABC exporter ATP-binding protein CcmA [Oryzicola mucosus]|uniref:Heme ABC exporter ATP-binding protein CcmA n=1 Tax=Oryzicola mucosus TaxID=2767425 RepID=A0A8J6U4B3_9HYPH|nr:heme ABC exporter ATP-binding protein CcmA [Oryzicola mucosus]MBD0413980.1 heme ABC exporter ATP-binding protein CcmA [Oryzicola mucosus]
MRLIADRLGGDRGSEIVFSDISFSLAQGDGLVVTGANGSGKSTLLRVMAGLLPVARGSIRLEDGGEFEDVAAACHYLGHENGMKTALTVTENLLFWQDFLGAPRLAPDEALEAVGLDGIGHLPFGYLSTGQRRRSSIARLLVSHRPIWLLDEPTAGLDKASERRLAGLMTAHLAEGGILVAATHLPLGVEGMQALEMEVL